MGQKAKSGNRVKKVSKLSRKALAKKSAPEEPITSETYQRRHMTAAERRDLKAEVDAELAVIRLGELRRACQVTQQQLAKKMGTSQANVARIEQAKGATMLSVQRVLHALGLKLEITRNGAPIWST
jgi:ribosome-binding protein aMBF1 (putative translation factor)